MNSPKHCVLSREWCFLTTAMQSTREVHRTQGRHRTPSQGGAQEFCTGKFLQENTKKFADSELERRFPFSRRRHFERKQLQRLFKCGDLTNLHVLVIILNYLFILFQTNTQHAAARVDSRTNCVHYASLYTCRFYQHYTFHNQEFGKNQGQIF